MARSKPGKKKSRKLKTPVAERPSMPGYGLPKGKKGLLTWSWAERRLARSHNYWVVTASREASPQAVPVWGIWYDSAFYFSTGRRSRKARNLAVNRRCVVCTEQAHEAVIVHGVAEEVTDRELIARLAGPYGKKYAPWKLDPSLGPIFAIRAKVAFGMFEKRFDQTATRWRF